MFGKKIMALESIFTKKRIMFWIHNISFNEIIPDRCPYIIPWYYSQATYLSEENQMPS